jgi:SNF2 family DNA or RNA helicase
MSALVSVPDPARFPWKMPPWDHQRTAWARACTMRDYALLFEMGCGKTATELNVLRWRYARAGKVLRTLIFAPVVALENWRREFGMHTNSQDQVAVVTGTAKQKKAAIHSGKPILITNYETLDSREMFDLLYSWHAQVIIVDESQRIKNYKAKRTKAMWNLGDNAQHRYILSGSPILNSPMDIYAQFRFLDCGETFGTNFFAFRAQYFYDKNAGMPSHKHFPDWRPRPGIEDEFNRLIYRKASRVTKAEALSLPPLVRKEAYAPMGKEQARMYASMKAALVAYLDDRACVAKIALTKALRLQQIVSGFFVDDEGVVTHYDDCPRLDALEELVQQIVIDAGNKLIIWACFRENYEAIGKVLARLKIDHRELIGGMTPTARQKAIDDFQDGNAQVMLANQGAGGVAINLTAANYMLYFSKNFNLEQELQSESRNHRGGSEIHDKITRIDLVCPGSIDEKINVALMSKETMAENVLSIRSFLG